MKSIKFLIYINGDDFKSCLAIDLDSFCYCEKKYLSLEVEKEYYLIICYLFIFVYKKKIYSTSLFTHYLF